MENLCTYAASEKETGSEKKPCKGKVAPNNTASFDLSLEPVLLSLQSLSISLTLCL